MRKYFMELFLIGGIVIGFMLLMVGSGHCQDTYSLYAIPKGHRVTVADGTTMQGYTLAEYKDLLLVDARLKACDTKLTLSDNGALSLKVAVDNLNTAVLLKEREKGLLAEDLVRKDKELTETVHDNLRLEQKLTVRKRFLRIGGSILGAVVTGLFLGLRFAR